MHQGGKLEYLSMTLDFSMRGVFHIDMSDYVKEVLSDFLEPVTKNSPTPHNAKVFNVHKEEDTKLLPEESAIRFH
jgi:hypothetical protein